ncbi:MAG: phage holin family protein [Armatimonadota bacterium]
MKSLLWHWVISTLALILAAMALSKGVHLSPLHALWIAPLFGIINAIVGGIAGIISFLATPLNLLTLGCFGFVLSSVLYTTAIYLLGKNPSLVSVFQVDSFLWALSLAIVMALFSTVLNIVLPGNPERKKKKQERD